MRAPRADGGTRPSTARARQHHQVAAQGRGARARGCGATCNPEPVWRCARSRARNMRGKSLLSCPVTVLPCPVTVLSCPVTVLSCPARVLSLPCPVTLLSLSLSCPVPSSKGKWQHQGHMLKEHVTSNFIQMDDYSSDMVVICDAKLEPCGEHALLCYWLP